MMTNIQRITQADQVFVDIIGSEDVHRTAISKKLAKQLIVSMAGFTLLDLYDDGGSVLVIVAGIA